MILQLLGITILAEAPVLYDNGLPGPFPETARPFLAAGVSLLGAVVTLLSWFIPWMTAA